MPKYEIRTTNDYQPWFSVFYFDAGDLGFGGEFDFQIPGVIIAGSCVKDGRIVVVIAFAGEEILAGEFNGRELSAVG